MSNYKIKVNNEAESKEAQELFFELGYEWNGSGKDVVSWRLGLLFTKEFQGKNCLCYFDKDEEVILGGWVGKEITLPQLRDLVAKSKQTEQGLISGADALRALADGKEVEFKCGGSSWRLLNAKQQPLEILIDQTVQFRLKPRTITLNVEIPVPFDPNNNEPAWVLDSSTPLGYKSIIHHVGCVHFMCWRTEDEIKQVVAALHGVLK